MLQLATALGLAAAALAATGGAAEPPRLTIPRIARAPQLDDFAAMDADDALDGMAKVQGFVQRFPNDGQAVTERTIVYVGYDDEFLHVAFVCFDREPGRIGAHLVGRDLLPNDDDTVAVHIDTFRDLKHAYGFQMNALGVQTDGTYTEGAGWDLSWDTVWRSHARLTPKGYVAVFSIPFRSLRFPPTDVQQWGMFFYRAIARRNEQVYWPECSTRFAARFPQAAVVDGVERVSPGRNLQAIPYASARALKRPDATRSREAAIGVDAKAVVKDSFVVDAAVNPDFSQVESDQPQITVNKPFEVFFPEKRPFFLENAAFFATPIQLLFTRRIADPLAGGRATGRTGAYSIGAMAVDDRAPFDGGPAERAGFGVVRVIRDVGRESYVGGFASSRTIAGRDNRVGAVDGRWKFARNWFATGQAAMSERGTAWYGSLAGAGRRFNYQLDVNDRSPLFRALAGFVPRIDIRSFDQTYSYRARPTSGALQAFGPDVVVNRTWDHEGRPLDWSATPRFAFQWPRLTTLDVYYTAGHQSLRPGEVPTVSRIVDAAIDRYGANFSSSWFSHVVGSATFFAGNAPNLTPAASIPPPPGRIVDATATASVRFSRSLTTDWSYLFDRLNDAATGRLVYSNSIVRLRIGDQFTRALSLRAIVQYDTLTVDMRETSLRPRRNTNYDVLFTYLTSPGTALYVGANSNFAPANTGWQVFTKLSYLLRR
jgi:hypothetical protein